ncbi:MAG: T9SS type A sorting domain-containing protein [Bacteroidia bacterium]|nr:T9SS type A sorting domain-containing protein [Bacteroidia bacterium]
MKTFLFLLGILISIPALPSWNPFGPEGIHANRIEFVIDNQSHWVICHDEGLYIYDLVNQTWTDHPTTLPVLDAYYLDGTKILVIMGDGTFSDGIYAYNPATEEFEIIEWVVFPCFLNYNYDTQKYYVGHHSGLLTSSDGYTWTAEPTFTNRDMVAMASWENHFVVSEMDNLYGVWFSDDYGATWSSPTPGSPMISNLDFSNEGILYGVFPDSSYSSGLWSSSDYGETWKNEFYSLNMSCVGLDVQGWVMVGWHENPPLPQEGIAHYTPATGSLDFLNEGLPNLFINDICFNPIMSAIALFCCTENGVYISYDYFVGETEINRPAASVLTILPNPAQQRAVITSRVITPGSGITMRIFDLRGGIIREEYLDNWQGRMDLNCSSLPDGLYLISVSGLSGTATCKLTVTH